MSKWFLTSLLLAVVILSAEQAAYAHILVSSGVGTANVTQIVKFSVGHGCAGNDTFAVTIDIPAGVTSVRPIRSDFGKVSVTKDGGGVITSVTWQKDVGDALDSDVAYYELQIRMKPPNAPFTTIYFPTHQTCRAQNGTLSYSEWIGSPTTGMDGGTAEDAPALTLLPERKRGWNTFTVAGDIPDLKLFFDDALIVWKGTAAYSSNAVTAGLIGMTSGVTALTSLTTGDTISVKY